MIVDRFDGRGDVQMLCPQARELTAVDVRSPPTNVHGPLRRDRTALAKKSLVEHVLVVDVGGTSVKILATGRKIHRSFPSGPKLTPEEMVSGAAVMASYNDEGFAKAMEAFILRSARE